MKHILSFSTLILIFLFSACSEKLPPKEYIRWVEDTKNGLKVVKTQGDFMFSLQYKPLPYIALRELDKDYLNQEELNREIDNAKGFQYYTLQISTINKKEDVLKSGLRNKDEYYSRIQYFSFLMQDDIKLIENEEQLACKLFHYERAYGLTPYQTFLIGFPSEASAAGKDKTFIYEDKVLGTGKIEITINGKDIVKTPSLIL